MSSGVRWTGSSVNSGGKLARSRSDSRRGLYGGATCFCSSCGSTRCKAKLRGSNAVNCYSKLPALPSTYLQTGCILHKEFRNIYGSCTEVLLLTGTDFTVVSLPGVWNASDQDILTFWLTILSCYYKNLQIDVCPLCYRNIPSYPLFLRSRQYNRMGGTHLSSHNLQILRLWDGYSDVLLLTLTRDVRQILLPPYLGNPEQWQDSNFPFFSGQDGINTFFHLNIWPLWQLKKAQTEWRVFRFLSHYFHHWGLG